MPKPLSRSFTRQHTKAHQPTRLHMRANIPHPASNLDEDTLAAIWLTLEQEGLAPQLFHDGKTQTLTDFLDFMTADDVYCYAVFSGSTPVAICWLNNFSGKAAMIHFAVFRAGMPIKKTIGRYVIEHLLTAQHNSSNENSHKDASAQYCLDALYGVTPESYRHVIRFIRQIGFRTLGVIPSALSIYNRPDADDSPLFANGGRNVGAVLSVISRNDLPASP